MKYVVSRCNPPQAVIFPQCTEHVSECAKICNEENITMVPFGTGTGMEGAVIPQTVIECVYSI